MEANTSCEHCGSERILPVVIGELSGNLLDLSLLEKLEPRGCFEFGVGASIWSCADCDKPVKTDGLLFESRETRNMRRYDETVESLFRNFVPLSDYERDVLRGQLLLRAVIRNYMTDEVSSLTFEATDSGFRMVVAAGDSNEVIESELTDKMRFRQIRLFALAINEDDVNVRGLESPAISIRTESGVARFSASFTPSGQSSRIKVVRA